MHQQPIEGHTQVIQTHYISESVVLAGIKRRFPLKKTSFLVSMCPLEGKAASPLERPAIMKINLDSWFGNK